MGEVVFQLIQEAPALTPVVTTPDGPAQLVLLHQAAVVLIPIGTMGPVLAEAPVVIMEAVVPHQLIIVKV